MICIYKYVYDNHHKFLLYMMDLKTMVDECIISGNKAEKSQEGEIEYVGEE